MPIIELTTDAGFETLANILLAGNVKIAEDIDVDLLLQKQAYADESTFAYPEKKMFSIADKDETSISLVYAEKCAHELPGFVVDKLNEAAAIYGLNPISVVYPEKQANDMFAVQTDAEVNKYASCTEYGTELGICLNARAALFPEYAEMYDELAKTASELTPQEMVSAIQIVDGMAGADAPWMETKVKSPAYAVFEKRASSVTVNLGSKQVPFEKLAEVHDVLDACGINVDFDAEDPYTIKLAIENLPKQIKATIAKYCV